MLIGIKIDGMTGAMTLDERIERVRAAAAAGFASVWSSEPTDCDPLTALAVVGRDVPRIALGTAIIHTYPRHPLVLASQALTVQAASGNRLSLGVGPGARFLIEEHFGYSFEQPGRQMREYLSALAPLLRGERVSYEGEALKAVGEVRVPGAEPPSLLVGALGPVMLRLAGALTDGTITAVTGPVAIADYVVPTIGRAAAAAGRPTPRVVASVSVCVTSDAAGARAWAAERFGFLGQLPGFRAMLDREGATGVEDVAIIGDETAVEREVGRYAAAGATEFVASPFGSTEDQARTIELLASLARATGITSAREGENDASPRTDRSG